MKLADQITTLRILLSPIVLWSLVFNWGQQSLLLYIVALATDVLDGYVARITDTASSSGAFLDVSADFLLAISGLIGCALHGSVGVVVILVSVFMFAQFISGFGGRVVYDPFGKLFGILVILSTPFILLSPGVFGHFIDSSIMLLGGCSLVGRWRYLGSPLPFTVKPSRMRHILLVNGLSP